LSLGSWEGVSLGLYAIFFFVSLVQWLYPFIPKENCQKKLFGCHLYSHKDTNYDLNSNPHPHYNRSLNDLEIFLFSYNNKDLAKFFSPYTCISNFISNNTSKRWSFVCIVFKTGFHNQKQKYKYKHSSLHKLKKNWIEKTCKKAPLSSISCKYDSWLKTRLKEQPCKQCKTWHLVRELNM